MKGPVTQKRFPFDDVIMWTQLYPLVVGREAWRLVDLATMQNTSWTYSTKCLRAYNPNFVKENHVDLSAKIIILTGPNFTNKFTTARNHDLQTQNYILISYSTYLIRNYDLLPRNCDSHVNVLTFRLEADTDSISDYHLKDPKQCVRR